MARWTQKERTLLSTHQVANLLQVDPTSIINWIKSGLLKAQKTPGGHRRIHTTALIEFLEEHQMDVPVELRLGRRRMMWIDDDEKYLKSIARGLKRQAPNVDGQFYDNGIDALSQIGFFKPHLLVLDIKMPGIDGFEVLERLKASDLTKDIKIIVVSGSADPDQRARAMKLGARAYLVKPVELGMVLKELGIEMAMAAA